MSERPQSPMMRRDGGCCSGECIAVATYHDDPARLLDYELRLCCCSACGSGFEVDDHTYARALLADAWWLRNEYVADDRCALEDRDAWGRLAAEWERLAGILAPDPRQVGFGFGERS